MPSISSISTEAPGSTSDLIGNVGSTTVRFSAEQLLSIPIDAEGDLLRGDSSNNTTRIAIGTSGYVLQSTGGVPKWVAKTDGDPSTGHISTIGTSGYVLQSTGGAAVWKAQSDLTGTPDPSTGHITTAGTSGQILQTTGSAAKWVGLAAGNLFYGNSSGEITELGIGTSGYILQSTGGIPAWVVNTGSSAGGALPSTAGISSGALLRQDAANTGQEWLASGSSGQTLETTGGMPTWVTNKHIVNVKRYGATGDGVTSDTTAISNAVSALSDGDALYFPPGIYLSTAAISISSKSISIRGDGMEASILRFTGTNGISLTLGTDHRTASIRDITIETNSAGTYNAITVTGLDVATSIHPHLLIDNVHIAPEIAGSQYWAEGIILDEVWGATITNTWISGESSYSKMTNGIRLANQSLEVSIIGCHLYHMSVGIKVDDVTPNSEGLTVTDPLIVNVNKGISWEAPTNGGLHLNVTGGHINAHTDCIRLDKVPQSIIQGVLMYKRSDSTQSFTGIYAKSSTNLAISGNIIRGATTLGAQNGIVLAAGTQFGTVMGNSISEQDTPIWLQSSANNNVVVGNAGNLNSTIVLDSGTSNISTHNNFT